MNRFTLQTLGRQGLAACEDDPFIAWDEDGNIAVGRHDLKELVYLPRLHLRTLRSLAKQIDMYADEIERLMYPHTEKV